MIYIHNLGKFPELGLGSGHIQDYQMTASSYHVDGTVYYPPWRARLGLDVTTQTLSTEASYLQLSDTSHWLQVMW